MRAWIFRWIDAIDGFDISKRRIEFQISEIAFPALLNSIHLLTISTLVTGRNDTRLPFG
jgi:hypothetical protein